MASHGPPRIGRDIFASREELAAEAQRPEVLGTVDPVHTDPTPQAPSAAWPSAAGALLAIEEAPPPWELSGEEAASDAKKYVEAPPNVTLRWINPRLLESSGMRGWTTLSTNDPRFHVKVDSMIAPDGTVRRNGATGDFLAWMLTSWVHSRRALLKKKTDELTQSAVNRHQQTREEMARGTFGPYIRPTEAKHPTHTMAEGRSMRD